MLFVSYSLPNIFLSLLFLSSCSFLSLHASTRLVNFSWSWWVWQIEISTSCWLIINMFCPPFAKQTFPVSIQRERMRERDREEIVSVLEKPWFINSLGPYWLTDSFTVSTSSFSWEIIAIFLMAIFRKSQSWAIPLVWNCQKKDLVPIINQNFNKVTPNISSHLISCLIINRIAALPCLAD